MPENKKIEGEFYTIITKIYNSDGECIAISNSYVPGEYEPGEVWERFWKWLDKRRTK